MLIGEIASAPVLIAFWLRLSVVGFQRCADVREDDGQVEHGPIAPGTFAAVHLLEVAAQLGLDLRS